MTYSTKLKDPRWQRARLNVLERDSFTCQKCFDKSSTLHVHHFVYQGEPWEVDKKYLTTLCETCHQEEEENRKEREQEFLKAMYSVGFLTSDLDIISRGLRNCGKMPMPSHVVSDFLGFIFHSGTIGKFIFYYLCKITGKPINTEMPRVIYDYYTFHKWKIYEHPVKDWQSLLLFWLPKSARVENDNN